MSYGRYRNPRKTELRYVVAKSYYKDGDELRDEFPILYGTEAEANDMKTKLENGSDKSFFDADDQDESPVLYIDTVEL